MFSEQIDFFAAHLELQASDVHDGNQQHCQCRRCRQRSEDEQNRKGVDWVANDAKRSAENQRRLFSRVDAESPGPAHLPPAREGRDGRADADYGADEPGYGPCQVVSKMMKMAAKSQPGLDTPRRDRWNPKNSNPSSRALARNQINSVRFLSGEAKRLAHDCAPIDQKATACDQRW